MHYSTSVIRSLRALCAIGAAALTITACGASTAPNTKVSASSQTTAARTAKTSTRHQVCRRLARFVGNYDYVQQGTSVRAYDILYHSLQVSCPKETRTAELVGVIDHRPPCKTLAQSRFTCQAIHDPYLSSIDTADLEAVLPGS